MGDCLSIRLGLRRYQKTFLLQSLKNSQWPPSAWHHRSSAQGIRQWYSLNQFVNSDMPGVDSCCGLGPWRCSWPNVLSAWSVSTARKYPVMLTKVLVWHCSQNRKIRQAGHLELPVAHASLFCRYVLTILPSFWLFCCLMKYRRQIACPGSCWISPLPRSLLPCQLLPLNGCFPL